MSLAHGCCRSDSDDRRCASKKDAALNPHCAIVTTADRIRKPEHDNPHDAIAFSQISILLEKPWPSRPPFRHGKRPNVTRPAQTRTSVAMKEGSIKPASDWRRWTERLPIARDRPMLGSLAMIAIVALAWAARTIADPLLPPGFPTSLSSRR
ncbi:hypothetical protein [Sphingomonas hankookensis]|uniref:hypothetical protein n=1 Tax=Sphingomonas hankookensis TaxID=563996 RepID=UPI003D302840